MSITDELREYSKNSDGVLYSAHQAILAIADRIDAEHERVCKEQYACGVEHGIGASIEASMIQEHGFIELPKDADGVPIRLGDKVYQVKGGWVYTVKGISFYHDNTSVTFEGEHGFGNDNAHNVHHYHAPTVEDLLFSYGQSCIRTSNEAETDAAKQTMLSNLRHEYAAKLRLAEGEDE